MRRRWVFLALTVAITLGAAIANRPRVGLADKWGTSWKAGWPTAYEVWGEAPDGTTYGYRFSRGRVLVDAAAWLTLIGVAWLLTRPHRRTTQTTQRVA